VDRWTLHVPENYNDGSPVEPSVFEEIEDKILRLAGGFTRKLARGAWRGDEQDYHEPVGLYLIDTEDPSLEAELLELARDIAARLSQEAVYLTRQVIDTFLVTPAREEITA